MLLLLRLLPVITFLNLFFLSVRVCKAGVHSRTSPTQEHAEVSGSVQLDNKPVVASDELMYKSDTDERLSAAEKAFGGGGGGKSRKYASKEEELKDVYEFNSFYNPEKWEQMLDDSDYDELDQEMRKIKAARWKTKTKDADDEEELDVAATDDDTTDEFDEDYEAREVPSVDVQLDAQSQNVSRIENLKNKMLEEDEAMLTDEERSVQTADKLASWMDVVGGDPEFTRQSEEEEAKEANTFDLYNLFSAGEQGKKDEAGDTVVEGETKEVDLLNMDKDDDGDEENDEKKVRRKRSYQNFDDDYSGALAEHEDTEEQKKKQKKSKKSSMLDSDDGDDEELIENDQNFDEDDYTTSEDQAKEDKKEDIVEEEDVNVKLDNSELLDKAAKKEIDKEYDEATAQGREAPPSRVLHHANKDQTKEYKTKVRDKKRRSRVKNTRVRDVRHRYEVENPDDGRTDLVQVRARHKDQWMDAPRRHHRRQRIPTYHRKEYFDEDDGDRRRTVAVSLGDHNHNHNHNSRKHRLRLSQKREHEAKDDDQRYDDDDGDDTDKDNFRTTENSHHSRRPPKHTNELTSYRYQRRGRVPRQSFPSGRHLGTGKQSQVQSDVNSDEFSWKDLQQYDRDFAKGRNLDADTDIEMDVDDGSLGSRYADVCNKVREEFREPRSGGSNSPPHPGIKFTGGFKKGGNECDILCQRTEGPTSAYVLFHLKDWPCGPDNKGRCSLDGKCEATSED